MNDRLLKESDVLKIAFQLPYVVNSAFFDAVKALPSADRPSAVDLSSVYSTAYKSGYEKGKADKSGKWILRHHVWFCNQCGENPTKGMGYVQGKDNLYDFCPYCGARMEGADNE